jgi:hypothetical protein
MAWATPGSTAIEQRNCCAIVDLCDVFFAAFSQGQLQHYPIQCQFWAGATFALGRMAPCLAEIIEAFRVLGSVSSPGMQLWYGSFG